MPGSDTPPPAAASSASALQQQLVPHTPPVDLATRSRAAAASIQPGRDTAREILPIMLLRACATLALLGAVSVFLSDATTVHGAHTATSTSNSLFIAAFVIAAAYYLASTIGHGVDRLQTRRKKKAALNAIAVAAQEAESERQITLSDETRKNSQLVLAPLGHLVTDRAVMFSETPAAFVNIVNLSTPTITAASIAAPAVLAAIPALIEQFNSNGFHADAPVIYTGEIPRILRCLPEPVAHFLRKMAQGLINSALFVSGIVGLTNLTAHYWGTADVDHTTNIPISVVLAVFQLGLVAICSALLARSAVPPKAAKYILAVEHGLAIGALEGLQVMQALLKIALLCSGSSIFIPSDIMKLGFTLLSSGVGITAGTFSLRKMLDLVENAEVARTIQNAIDRGAMQIDEESQQHQPQRLGIGDALRLMLLGGRRRRVEGYEMQLIETASPIPPSADELARKVGEQLATQLDLSSPTLLGMSPR